MRQLKRRKVLKQLFALPRDVIQNRRLILTLAKNDFKTRFAGSYLGIVWAFVQPVITVLLYWFVFQVGFRSVPVGDIPYVLFLTAGLIPWFFFSEAMMSGMNCMMEYSYLVKKVVFKISILPMVKLVSALFVHLFFVGFLVLLYALMGFAPDFYTLQVVYYSVCMFVLVLCFTYFNCSIVIFFRDWGQIMNIILQVVMWMTPIMWDYHIIKNPVLLNILKLNPLYYIVEGYRDALIHKVWFWENWKLSLYFWGFTLIVFLIGTTVYKKLRGHFADVL